MKKVLAVILMALAVTALFVSCDDPKHEHSYDAAKWEKDGTSHWHVCTTCSEKVEVATHTLETTGAKEPTCTESGWDKYESCSICGYSTKKEKAATEHNYADPVVEDGKVVQKCNACGYKNYDIENATIVVTDEKSLIEAINAVGVGTVKLGDAVEIKDKLEIKKSIIVDLNSKKLTITGETIKADENIAIEIKNIAEGQDPISIVGPKVLRMSSDAKECGYYPTFKDAVENAGSYDDTETVSYDTICLLANVELTDSITLNKKIGLVLNEKNLTGADKITIVDNGAVLVDNTETSKIDKAFSGTVAKSTSSYVTAYYPSFFDAALNAASSGDTITLLSDVTLTDNSGPILISKNLTIDLADKKLDLKDGVLKCDGTIKFMNGEIVSEKGNEDPVIGSYVISFTGSLTFDDVKFTQTGLACSILYTEKGDLSIINSKFNCVARDSVVAAYRRETTVTITGSKIYNSGSEGNVTVIYPDGTQQTYPISPATVMMMSTGTCKIENSEIKGTGNGAQAVNATSATVTISGSSTIIEGTSDGLVIGSGATATVNDSFIKGDCVVSVTDGTCNITNSTIETTSADTTTLYVEAKKADASLKLSSVKLKSGTSVKVEKKNANGKSASLTNDNATCEGGSLTLESVSE